MNRNGGSGHTPDPVSVQVLHGAKIAILGVAFKPNSDDVRDSPALDVANRLYTAGAEVAVYDPKGNANAATRFPRLGYVNTCEQALTGADLVILLTEWDEFTALDPTHVATLVNRKNIIDGRNVLDRCAWTQAGFTHAALGHQLRKNNLDERGRPPTVTTATGSNRDLTESWATNDERTSIQ